MRPRFSLRLFLIAFTLLAILFGAGGRYLYQTKDKVRRSKAAIAKLESEERKIRQTFVMDCRREVHSPTKFESLVNIWIDKEAFPPPRHALLGAWRSYQYQSKDVEEVLEIIKDVNALVELTVSVDCLTVNAARRIASQRELRFLELDCATLEPGAALELQRLTSLEWLKSYGAYNEEMIVAAGNMPRLKHLSIQIKELGRAGAPALSSLKSLESICLFDYELENSQPTPFLKQLADLPNLAEIELSFLPMDEEAAVAISQVSSLKRLNIQGFDSLPEKFLATIARLKEIESIVVNPNNMTPNCDPAAVASCRKLKQLYAASVIYTKEDLHAFDAHPALQRMVIRGAIPLADIEQFLKATPNCELSILQLDATVWQPFAANLGDYDVFDGQSYRWNAGRLEMRWLKDKSPWTPLDPFE